MADLEQIRVRAAAASDGPWQRHGSDVWTANSSTPLFTGRDASAKARQQADADAEFVAHARGDITDLLALLDQQSVDQRSAPSRPRNQPETDTELGCVSGFSAVSAAHGVV